jgi:hypothetical protein
MSAFLHLQCSRCDRIWREVIQAIEYDLVHNKIRSIKCECGADTSSIHVANSSDQPKIAA